MKFEVLEDGSGVFSHSDQAARRAAEKFTNQMAGFGKGRVGSKRMIAVLERFTEEMPGLLEPYELLASIHVVEGRSAKALGIVQKGLSAANRLLPDDFKGKITWAREGNRPYLGLMRMTVTCLSGMRKHKEAAAFASMILAMDPDDGACVRFAAGHEYLRAGELEKARRLFHDHAREYPPFCYELGLSLFNEQQFVSAATAWRRGFATNPYIAMGLFAGEVPNAYPVAHYDWLEGPESASGYLGTYGEIWDEMTEAQRFLYWLFNHSKVMQERAAIMACKEDRPFTTHPDPDSDAVRREWALIDAIDDTLSVEIVHARDTPDGPLWPWNSYEGVESSNSIH